MAGEFSLRSAATVVSLSQISVMRSFLTVASRVRVGWKAVARGIADRTAGNAAQGFQSSRPLWPIPAFFKLNPDVRFSPAADIRVAFYNTARRYPAKMVAAVSSMVPATRMASLPMMPTLVWLFSYARSQATCSTTSR